MKYHTLDELLMWCQRENTNTDHWWRCFKVSSRRRMVQRKHWMNTPRKKRFLSAAWQVAFDSSLEMGVEFRSLEIGKDELMVTAIEYWLSRPAAMDFLCCACRKGTSASWFACPLHLLNPWKSHAAGASPVPGNLDWMLTTPNLEWMARKTKQK